MVYLKANGNGAFSWQKQLDYLKREDPDNLEEIAHTKLMLLKQQEPEKADYYENLDNQLSDRINNALDETPDFGFDHAQALTHAFLIENDLETLLEDPETPTHSYWCYRCEDFTPHKPMENGNTYCLTCHHERESALTRYMPQS